MFSSLSKFASAKVQIDPGLGLRRNGTEHAFFLDAIKETHNNDHPLAIYHQKIPLLLELVREKHENIRLSGA